MQQTKRWIGIFSVILSLVNLALFLIFFLPYYKYEVESEAWDYCQYFITFAAEFLLPTLAAVTVFYCAEGKNKKSALLPALYLSLPRVIYLLPYYYLYMTAYGNDWLESITLSFLVSVAGLAVMWIRILVFAAVIHYAAIFVGEKTGEQAPQQKNLTQIDLTERLSSSPFNLSKPVTAGIFAMAALQFVIYTVTEIIDIVVFLVEIDYGTFRPSELIYTISKFTVIFVMLFISHVLAHLLIRKLNGGTKAHGNL